MFKAHERQQTYYPVQKGQSWETGILTRLPWFGFLGLLGALLSVAGSAIVLIASHESLVSNWKFQPAVYLAILSTLTNILLHFALSEGVSIAWWVRTVKKATPLDNLHRNWDYGNSLYAAITSGKRFNLIALASILTAIAPINGPLLQRSTTVAFQNVVSNITMAVSALQVLNQPTGTVSGRGYVVAYFTDQFSSIVQDFYDGVDINVASSGCSGSCKGRLRAAGFAIKCNTSTASFDLGLHGYTGFGSDSATEDRLFGGFDTFETQFGWSWESDGYMNLDILYKDQPNCSANPLVVHNCTFQIATVYYPVIVDANQSTITLDPQSTIFDDIVEQTIVVEDADMFVNGNPSILGGLAFALNNKYLSTGHLQWAGTVGYQFASTGSTVSRYAIGGNSFNCDPTFKNPLGDLAEAARQLMFRTAIAWGDNTTIQHVVAEQTASHLMYQSRYLFLGLSVLASVLAIVAVSIIYHGYWHLGRKVTMSPLELAKAFNAPILSQGDSNAEASDLVKSIGDRIVRYGAVAVSIPSDESDDANKPEDPGAMTSMRLEIADVATVYTPTQGATFVAQSMQSPDQQSLL